jgi:hypothetical protein
MVLYSCLGGSTSFLGLVLLRRFVVRSGEPLRAENASSEAAGASRPDEAERGHCGTAPPKPVMRNGFTLSPIRELTACWLAEWVEAAAAGSG